MALTDWNALLHVLRLRVVGGPDAAGAYIVGPMSSAATTPHLLQQLRATHGVRLAEAIAAPADAQRSERKPILACVPSQNGLVALPPQRHRFAVTVRATTRPVPLMICRLPRTRQRPVGLRIDGQRAVDLGNGIRLRRRRLAGGVEATVMMRTIAERFVLRGPAPAQRGAKSMRFAVDDQRRAERIGAALAHAGQVHRWRLLLRTAVQPRVADGARRTQMGDLHHRCQSAWPPGGSTGPSHWRETPWAHR